MRIACVASVSVRFRSKERGRRVKDAQNMVQVKERGGGGEEGKVGFLPPPPSPPSFSFWLSFQISRAAKTGLSLLRNQTETLATQAIVGAKLRNPTQHNQPWGSYTHAQKTVSLSNANPTGQTSYTFHSTDSYR